MRSLSPGIASALAAALLFGASTPAAKLLLEEADPWVLAGLLYLGSGVGLAVAAALRRWVRRRPAAEAPLSRADWGWLALAVLFGGLAGPVLLAQGLARTSAATASLLLNLEAVLTALLAWFVFKENFDRRILLGMAAIAAGGVVLSWPGEGGLALSPGALLVVAACLAWAVDNNLTRKLSGGDPLKIAMTKGLVAGAVNVGLALAGGAPFPAAGPALLIPAVGLVGYGVSLMLFIRALRHLGAARTGAYFALAPFVGALAAVAGLGETLTPELVIAGVLMVVGVTLHLTERHAHEHTHRELAHEHQHSHDEHHRHDHLPGTPSGEPHSHAHGHAEIRHTHPHYPDLHHRHGH